MYSLKRFGKFAFEAYTPNGFWQLMFLILVAEIGVANGFMALFNIPLQRTIWAFLFVYLPCFLIYGVMIYCSIKAMRKLLSPKYREMIRQLHFSSFKYVWFLGIFTSVVAIGCSGLVVALIWTFIHLPL